MIMIESHRVRARVLFPKLFTLWFCKVGLRKPILQRRKGSLSSSVFLKLEHGSESPGGLHKAQIVESHLQSF